MNTPSSNPGPLKGLRVLDLSTVVMGPYASLLLADMGADVVKLESPAGDQVRFYQPQRGTDLSGLFISLHRNKRGIVLDLKDPAAQAAFGRLAATFDVVLHNFRPQVASKLGATYDQLRELNPQVIVCKVYGFGADGPYSDKPAYDDVIQAASGLAALHARVRGEPQYVPSMICDKIVGQAAALAILAACHQRNTQGHGSEVEVPMFETMVAFNLVENLAMAAFDPPMGRIGWARNISPMRKPFRTADGFVCLLPYSDRNWRDFLTFSGHPEVLQDARFRTLPDRAQNIDALYKYVEDAAPMRTTREWVEFCEAHGIPCSPVNEMEALWDDEHLKVVSMFDTVEHPTQGRYRVWRSPLRFSDSQWELRRHAPHLGEHTREVLKEAGFAQDEVTRLAPGHAEPSCPHGLFPEKE